MNILFFDTETTGLVWENKHPTDPKQPMPVQIGIKLDTVNRKEVAALNYMVRPEGWTVEPKAAEHTGITTEIAQNYGVHFVTAVDVFLDYLELADVVVAHNARFDVTVMRRSAFVHAGYLGIDYKDPFEGKKIICTMLASMDEVKAIPRRKGQWKWPKLEECIEHFFREKLVGAHDALTDVRATSRVFYELLDKGIFNA